MIRAKNHETAFKFVKVMTRKLVASFFRAWCRYNGPYQAFSGRHYGISHHTRVLNRTSNKCNPDKNIINKIHVQTNTESVQCLSINTKQNIVSIIQVNEQLA